MTDLDPTENGPESGVPAIAQRFRGFLPVVVDVETGGFNNATDALLEIAAVTVDFNSDGDLELCESVSYHVEPFEGANIEPASLEVNGIDPHHPLRPALPEREALARVFKMIRARLKETGCKRAVLVGHNAHFDLGFLNAAIERSGIKRSPFHPFSCFDTATLAGVALGQTVLRRAATAAGMSWDNSAAHSALYDTEQTARLFCTIVNRFRPVYENIPPLPQE
ncbi:ribonuclease T [Salinisphaera dokdonensis CL-ES53]|jgi:ribonuclease T|uniref:Ribonuclease T n=1 Tax=Salinisphaera dokdonensis CL-ES53 TaxID=1304272 RepID=A0ABV2B152_9GAMM